MSIDSHYILVSHAWCHYNFNGQRREHTDTPPRGQIRSHNIQITTCRFRCPFNRSESHGHSLSAVRRSEICGPDNNRQILDRENQLKHECFPLLSIFCISIFILLDHSTEFIWNRTDSRNRWCFAFVFDDIDKCVYFGVVKSWQFSSLALSKYPSVIMIKVDGGLGHGIWIKRCGELIIDLDFLFLAFFMWLWRVACVVYEQCVSQFTRKYCPNKTFL